MLTTIDNDEYGLNGLWSTRELVFAQALSSAVKRYQSSLHPRAYILWIPSLFGVVFGLTAYLVQIFLSKISVRPSLVMPSIIGQ